MREKEILRKGKNGKTGELYKMTVGKNYLPAVQKVKDFMQNNI